MRPSPAYRPPHARSKSKIKTMKQKMMNHPPLHIKTIVTIGILGAVTALLTACGSATPTPVSATTTPTAPSVNAAPLPTVNASDSPKQHVDKAKAALKDRRFDVALAEVLAATEKDAANSDGFFVLGNVYNQSAGNEADSTKRQTLLTQAITAYKTALKLSPDNDAAHTNLGTVYYQLGQFDAARQSAEAALKIKPDDARTHYLLGTIYLQNDPTKQPEMLDKAQSEFDKAIQSESDLGAAYVGLANIKLFKGDFAGAMANAQKGVDLMKDGADPFALWALAQAQCKGGNKAAGAQTLLRITAMNVPDTQFVQQLQALAAQCK